MLSTVRPAAAKAESGSLRKVAEHFLATASASGGARSGGSRRWSRPPPGGAEDQRRRAAGKRVHRPPVGLSGVMSAQPNAVGTAPALRARSRAKTSRACAERVERARSLSVFPLLLLREGKTERSPDMPKVVCRHCYHPEEVHNVEGKGECGLRLRPPRADRPGGARGPQAHVARGGADVCEEPLDRVRDASDQGDDGVGGRRDRRPAGKTRQPETADPCGTGGADDHASSGIGNANLSASAPATARFDSRTSYCYINSVTVAEFDLKTLCERARVTPRTVHFYMQQGLLASGRRARTGCALRRGARRASPAHPSPEEAASAARGNREAAEGADRRPGGRSPEGG